MKKLSSGRLFAFASMEIPMAAFLKPIIVFIPPFYAGELGLGLSLVGLLFGLSKLWDIVTDPILAAICEKYKPKKEPRRFWFLLSIPVMLVGVYKIFFPEPGVTGWYFMSWMMFLYIGWTVLLISHISWGLELGTDYHDRSRVASYRQSAHLIGSLIIFIIPVIADQLPGASDASRIKALGYFLLVSLPVHALLVVWSNKEPQQDPPDDVANAKSQARVLDFFRIFRSERNMRVVVLANMAVILGAASTSSMLLFYVDDVLQLGNWATFAIVPLLFSGLLFLPVWKRAALRFGKSHAFSMSMLIQTGLVFLFFAIPPNNLPIAVVAFLLIGANLGTTLLFPQAMVADIAMVDAANRDSPRTSIYVALLQSTSKICGALSVFVTYLILPYTGFDPQLDVNEPSSLFGVRMVIVFLPAAYYLLGWLVLSRYDLSESAVAMATSKRPNSAPLPSDAIPK